MQEANPFHYKYLRSCSERFRVLIEEFTIRLPELPVYCVITITTDHVFCNNNDAAAHKLRQALQLQLHTVVAAKDTL